MELINVHITGKQRPMRISITDDRITDLSPHFPSRSRTSSSHPSLLQPPASAGQLSFKNALAFPGLINSHDHLDFNLFPSLRSRIYKSYTEWGSDIHRCYAQDIADVLRIPQHLRTSWGIYKNLLNGITTVVHHGQQLPVTEDLISVCQQARSFHYISGEKYWRLKLMTPCKTDRPVAIHIGEGSTPASYAEINTLIKWNILRRRIIGIHGVSMTEQQAASFQALVWCPDSNYFLLGRTASVGSLKNQTRMLFGTDSTLSASWSLWEQLRTARTSEMTSDTELFDMITSTPAAVWGLKDRGSLAPHMRADIVIARRPDTMTGWDAFYSLDPGAILLVMHKGQIQLFDHTLYDQLTANQYPMSGFYAIRIAEHVKFIRGDLPGLINEIRRYHPSVDLPISLL